MILYVNGVILVTNTIGFVSINLSFAGALLATLFWVSVYMITYQVHSLMKLSYLLHVHCMTSYTNVVCECNLVSRPLHPALPVDELKVQFDISFSRTNDTLISVLEKMRDDHEYSSVCITLGCMAKYTALTRLHVMEDMYISEVLHVHRVWND